MLNLISVLLLIFIGFLGWKAWGQMKKNAAQSHSDTANDTPSSSRPNLEKVYPGGMIRLPAHGDNLDPLDVQITARHLYDQNGYQWLELQGDSENGTVWLDVENDDELCTSVTLQRMTLDQVGLTEAQLTSMKAGQGQPLEHQGITFNLEEKGTALFCPNGDRNESQQFEYWDFEGSDERHDLAIERWDDDIRVYFSQRLTPSRITVYSHGESA